MKVVVIGAGFGGVNAVKELSKDPEIEVVLIDKRNYHLFQPFLYQVATAGLSPADISVPTRSIFKKRKNVEVIMGAVTSIDSKNKTVSVHDGKTFEYDKLIVAAGAKNFVFNKEWEPYVLGMKSVQDALAIRKRLLMSFELAEVEPDPKIKKALMTFVVIGGGPTGVELAGAIAELARFSLAQDFRVINPKDARVILIEAGDKVLSTFGPKLSEKAKLGLERLGVSVWLKSRVTSITEGRVELDDDTIGANTIIWAAGVKSVNIDEDLGISPEVSLEKGDRVPVEDDLKVRGMEDVYAIGDLAIFKSSPLPGIAPVAIQQGTHVGKELRREFQGKEYRPFHYVDKGQMATVGRSRAIAEVRGMRVSGLLAWYLWVFIHIYFLIGFRNRVAVLLQWFWSYMTFKKGARIIN